MWLETGPVTADLTTTVIHSSKWLINDVKPDHSLILLGNKPWALATIQFSTDGVRWESQLMQAISFKNTINIYHCHVTTMSVIEILTKSCLKF